MMLVESRVKNEGTFIPAPFVAFMLAVVGVLLILDGSDHVFEGEALQMLRALEIFSGAVLLPTALFVAASGNDVLR